MTGPTTILIVEREEELRLWMADILQREGFKIFSASTSEEALKMVYEHVPNLIVFDFSLTKDGYKLFRNLRQDLMLSHIPFVVLTERDNIGNKTFDAEFVADDYIFKPVEEVELLARIKMAVGRTHLELDVNPLTRLSGHNSILRKLEDILSKKTAFAVCYVDLDNFKSFNDKYGFNRGDDVIRFTSGLISKVVKESQDADDFIGHIGGDEFVVITKPEKVDKFCSKIISEFDLAIPQFYDEEERRQGHIIKTDRHGNSIKTPVMSVSIAVVTNEKKELFHVGQISKLAMELKHYAKSFSGSIYFKDRRQDRYSIISGVSQEELIKRYEEMRKGARKRIDQRTKKIEALRRIIEQEDINILFQPIVCFRTKSIIGYEALTRGPKGTELESPELLFDLAREGNMLWQLDRLCRKKILSYAGDFNNNLSLFLNTSPESIYDPEFRRAQFLENCPLKPENLVIEVTERGMVEDFAAFYEILKSIQEKKIKIAIDDAGSSYVSLRNVAKLKPDYIKIDISVIRNIDVDKLRQDVLSTWFTFSQRIDSVLIAEGIETKEEFGFLFAIGVPLGQGYLFARPGNPYPLAQDF